MIPRLIAAILFALPFMQTSSGLTSDERSLGAYIDAHNHEALALLDRLNVARRLHQRFVRTGVEPGDAARQLLDVQQGSFEVMAVDVRVGSPTFGRWCGVTLSAENFRQCYVPPGFAHGFCVLSPVAQVEYKCTDVYDRATEIGVAWNDPAIAIAWPVQEPMLSKRDREHSPLARMMDVLPRWSG